MIIDINGRRYPTVTESGIYGFFGVYSFLSNFHHSPFEIDGDVWPTTEHYYMWCKSKSDIDKSILLSNPDPKFARKYGTTEIVLSPDWDLVKPHAMLKCNIEKYRQNPKEKQLLLDTGLRYLEETNNWNDVYWGVCGGFGLNMLGKTLMHVRDLAIRGII